MSFEDLKKIVDDSYKERTQREAEAHERIWRGFRNDVERLTSFVHIEFGKILSEIGPVSGVEERYNENGYYNAEITEYLVKYLARRREFEIKIEKFKTGKGKIIGGDWCNECPHNYLSPITSVFDDELHPKILEFKKKYGVGSIRNPPNNCEHK